jgi:hypothetical protein
LAIRLLETDDGSNAVFEGLALRFDRGAFTASIDVQVADAVEWVSPPRRGRPPVPRLTPDSIDVAPRGPEGDGAPLSERRPV